MLLFEGTSPLDQARNRESPRCQPRHGGFCSHRNPDKVSSSDRFFQIPTLHRLERGALPDRFANFFQSVVFTNGGMRYHLINFRLAQVEFSIFNFQFSIWDTTSKTLDLRRWNFHCNPIPYSFIPDSFEITFGKSSGRIWIKVIAEWYPILNFFAYSEI